MDKKAIFSLLDLTILTSCGSKLSPTIQTDTGEGANTRVGKESDHKTRKTSPIHKLTKQP